MGLFDFFKKKTVHNMDTTVTANPPKKEEPLVETEVHVAAVSPMDVHAVETEKLKNIPPLDLMKVKYVDSPNKSKRKGEVKYIVLHHTGPGSFSGIVKWLCNPQAKASAHYVVSTGGTINQLVNTGKEAWHAGVAKFKGKRIDNHCSIGIEICNHGVLEKGDDGNFYYQQGRQLKKYTGKTAPVPAEITYPSGAKLSGYAVPYPDKQVEKVVALCKGLVKKYPQIKPEDIITHYDIGHPEGRKNDPFGLDIDLVRKLVFYNG